MKINLPGQGFRNAAFSRDSALAVLCFYDDRPIRVWNRESGEVVAKFESPGERVVAVDVSAAGDQIAAGTRDGKIGIWNVKNRQLVLVEQAATKFVWNVKFSPDGGWLAVAGRNGTTIWDVANRRKSAKLGMDHGCRALAFSPDGDRLAVGAEHQNRITVWDIKTGRKTRFSGGHTRLVQTLAFSHDGQLLASGGGDYVHGELYLWDVESNRRLATPCR